MILNSCKIPWQLSWQHRPRCFGRNEHSEWQVELVKVLNGAQIVSDDEGWHWKTFKKGEVVMKKMLLAITMATLLLTLASSGEAWQVTIANNTDRGYRIDVYGEHLFWKQVDCSINVSANSTGTCTLPGIICPVYFRIVWSDGRGDLEYPNSSQARIAHCWNSTLVIYMQDNGTYYMWQ